MNYHSFYDTPYRKAACVPNVKAQILHSLFLNECKTALFPSSLYIYTFYISLL